VIQLHPTQEADAPVEAVELGHAARRPLASGAKPNARCGGKLPQSQAPASARVQVRSAKLSSRDGSFPSLLHWRRWCRQQMDCAHDRADKPFDKPAKVRPADRSVKQVDPIFACTPLRRLRLEFGSIIEVQQLRQATCRPSHLQLPISASKRPNDCFRILHGPAGVSNWLWKESVTRLGYC
jgi:hypothetical protein